MKKLFLALIVLSALLLACGCAAPDEGTDTATGATIDDNAAANDTPQDSDLVYLHIYETTAAQMENPANAAALADFAAANFQHEAAGTVKICAADGYSMETTAEQVLACTIEQTAENGVMLSDPELNVKNIRYYTNQPWGFSQTLLVGFFADLDSKPGIQLEQRELSEAVWLSREEMPESDASISMTAKMMEAFRLGEDV